MEKLTVSQALRRIKELKGFAAKHLENAGKSLTYQEKNKPAHVFSAEVNAYNENVAELSRLQVAVAISNATTEVKTENGHQKIVAVIKRLEEIKGLISWYESLVCAPHKETLAEVSSNQYDSNGRYTTLVTEKKIICELPEVEREAKVLSLKEEFSSLNNLVETSNHNSTI